ncbi:hypothetical protein BH10BAC2_BH10BAC2_46770 [soil metagenome]
MADMHIDYTNIHDSANYRRALNLDSALWQTTFKSNYILYGRTAFVSFPDNLMVIRNTASKTNSISFRIVLSAKVDYTISIFIANTSISTTVCRSSKQIIHK